MSDQWHGGKGDKPRVGSDRTKYENNWKNIFGKDKEEPVMVNVAPSGTLPEWQEVDDFQMSFDFEDTLTEREVALLNFLKNIDEEEYPVQAAKELYKKWKGKAKDDTTV